MIASKRNSAIDFYKLVFSLFVVGIHSSLFSKSFQEISVFLCDGVFRVAVGFFFFVSGYFVVPRILSVEGGGKILIKYLRLYLFWLMLYFPLMLFSLKMSFPKILVNIVFGYHHLWFLVALFLGGWVLKKIYCVLSGVKISVLAVVFYVAGVVLQYLVLYFDWLIPHFAYRNFLFYAFPMLWFGYCYSIKGGGSVHIWGKWAALAFCLELCCSTLFGDHRKGVDLYIFLLPTVFYVFHLIVTQRLGFIENVKDAAKLSSFVYFIHPLVIFFVMQVGVVQPDLVFLYTVPVCVVWFYCFKKIFSNKFTEVL